MDLTTAQRILGIAPGASDIEVRSAYRRLLRTHHPDVAGGAEGPTSVEARDIIEAYRVVRAGVSPVPPPTSPTPARTWSPPPPRPRPPAPPTASSSSTTTDPSAAAPPRAEPQTRKWAAQKKWTPKGATPPPGQAARAARRSGGAPPPKSPPRAHGWKPPAWLSSPDTLSIAAPADEALPYLIDAAHRFGEVTYLDSDNGLFETVIQTTSGATMSLVVTLQGRGLGSTEAFFTVEAIHAPAGTPVITAHDLAAAFAEDLNGKN